MTRWNRFFAGCLLTCISIDTCAQNEHASLYARPVPGDAAVAAAKELKLTMPVMCREWHIWWGAPYGKDAYTPEWKHWKGLRPYGKFDPATTIEQLVQGLAWRRNLNCTGYPLLGPYDSGQRDVIRWQLQTAKNAGIECLNIHLWPSIWDDGLDMTPIHIVDIAFEVAEELNYPIALHDEIMFRDPKISKGRELQNCIRRTVSLLTRYKESPALYRIDGLPFYYLQNWNNWISTNDMAAYVSAVEEAVGPVYWIVEGGDTAILNIPQIKAYAGPHVDWFMHTPPYGAGPHPWEKLSGLMKSAADTARAHGKKYIVNIKPRFNNTKDRGEPGRGVIPGEDGLFLIQALKQAKEVNPDFIILAQWNDFEECAFIEPAWDFDGFNGDPYRYCRIVAASLGKEFTPAPLPDRECLDPLIRPKLFSTPAKGDCGPVLQNVTLSNTTLRWTVAKEGRTPESVRVIQARLPQWVPGDTVFRKQPLRLANDGSMSSGVLEGGKAELRFYLPGMIMEEAATVWVGIQFKAPPETTPIVNYRSVHENYRIDSSWERRRSDGTEGVRRPMNDGSELLWFPLYGTRFNGTEGDLILRLNGKKERTEILRVIVWHPNLRELNFPVTPADSGIELPQKPHSGQVFVVCAYDALGNPGLPVVSF